MGGYRCKIRADLRIVDMREPRVTKVLEKSVRSIAISNVCAGSSYIWKRTWRPLFTVAKLWGISYRVCIGRKSREIEHTNLSYPVVKCNELERQPS